MISRAILFTVAFAVASSASADLRENWHAIAEAARSSGLSDSAAQIEAAVAALSDEELERVYGNADLAGLADALWASTEALKAVDEATGGIASQQALRAGLEQSRSVSGFPDAVGYPSSPFPCPFSPDRSNADALLAAVDSIAVARDVLEVAKGVWSGLSRACGETVVIGGLGGNTELACIPADAALALAETGVGLAESTVEHIDFCDAAVDAAEIEGSYERLGHLHTDWTSKFPGEVTDFRRGHGCNGIDDNASGVIDECGEDTYPPVVHIDAAVSNVWYRSLAEASAAVSRGFLAFDECQTTSEEDPVIGGSCDSVAASVTASDACGNAAMANTVVKVDSTPPSVLIDTAVENQCVTSVKAGEQAVLAATTLGDDCTPVSELDFRLDSTVTECSLRVREEAIDHAGNRTVNAVTVRSDAERPAVEIERLLLGFRGEVLGFQTPVCYDTVAEAEAEVLQVTRMQDNCSAAEDVTRSVSSSGVAAGALVADERHGQLM